MLVAVVQEIDKKKAIAICDLSRNFKEKEDNKSQMKEIMSKEDEK